MSLIIRENHGRVELLRFNRPAQLNALNNALLDELQEHVKSLEADPAIACLVLTGSDRAFSAGADLKEFLSLTDEDARRDHLITRNWEAIAHARKPIIAAVSGLAIGGGFELAMMCDMIVAADDAKFGQPEIRVGTIPGAGGSQRLTRAVGKSKAMEMILTGSLISAAEAKEYHLVSRLTSPAQVVEVALKLAGEIAAFSQPLIELAKEVVTQSFERDLSDGIKFERDRFYSSFSLEDRSEGMQAFIEKRKPHWSHK